MTPDDMRSPQYEQLVRRFTEPIVLSPDSGTPGLPWSAPHEVPALDDELTAKVARAVDAASGVHGVVVAQHGQIVAEHYGAGSDLAWGRPLGHVEFTPSTLHDVRSVTKSVVSLLYGIAWGDGAVPDPSSPLLEQLPEHADLAADPARAALTIEHALTMTLGLRWREEPPYDSPANGEIAMMLSPDRWRYVLEQPVEHEPGTRWNYTGGASELVGRLVARGTGLPVQEFARTRLFAPLGIDGFEWLAGYDGVASSASGLRLAPRDLARIGRLVLDGGAAGGEQVVPGAWIERMLRPATATGWGAGYGYQWYLFGEGRRRWVGGIGNGDQRLFVHPELDLVIVVVTGNYDRAEWQHVAGVTSAVLDHLDP